MTCFMPPLWVPPSSKGGILLLDLNVKPGKSHWSNQWLTCLRVTLVLLLGMATTLLWNPRSLIGPALAFRSENALLFTFQPDLQGSYEAAANYSRSGWKHTLGLHIEGNRLYQYPLMRLLRENLYEPTFVPINVNNVSRKLQSNHRPPDIVVSLSPQTDMTDSNTGQRYLQIRAVYRSFCNFPLGGNFSGYRVFG